MESADRKHGRALGTKQQKGPQKRGPLNVSNKGFMSNVQYRKFHICQNLRNIQVQ